MNTAGPKFIRCRLWISRKNITISRTNPLNVNSLPSFNVGAVASRPRRRGEGVGKPQHDHNATPVSAASRRPDIQGLTASCPR